MTATPTHRVPARSNGFTGRVSDTRRAVAVKECGCLDRFGQPRRLIPKGESLYREGDPFHYLYAVRSGSFRTSRITEDGRNQVTGFHLTGEVMALDAIGASSHVSEAVSMEDSAASAIPYARLASQCRGDAELQRQFHALMSREIVRDHGVLLLLGSMCAEARLATFLLNLARRHAANGNPPDAFTLHMTRGDIGSYLGMRIETVSRPVTRFQARGLLSVRLRQVRILDMQGMRECLQSRAD